jgi:SAM-dependent methyltransferase
MPYHPAASSPLVHSPPTDTRLPHAVFGRAFRHGRRWDEGLWRWAELGAVLQLLREQPDLREGPILDVGCGDGEVFEVVFGPRLDACGVDSCVTRADDVARARAAGRYGEVRQEDAASTSFEADRFRLLFSNSVLEHIAPVEPVLREAFRVLRPGGCLLFTTPAPRLYSRQAYAWRRALAPLGLDFVGRRLALRECAVYHHVSILEAADWVRRLEVVGFSKVEVRGYMPAAAARAMSLFSGATRVPVLARLAWRLSPEARALATDLSEAEWVERCRTVLGPLLRDPGAVAGGDAPGSAGPSGYCGQLVLARKP